MPNELLLDALVAVVGVSIGIQVFHRIALADTSVRLHGRCRKAFRVIASRRISDHWKERALPRYALGILLDSLTLLFLLIALAAAFLIPSVALFWLVLGDVAAVEAHILAWRFNAFAMAICIAYLCWRIRRAPVNSDYGRIDRLFHRLVLGWPFLRRIAFDVDCSLARGAHRPSSRPVYVTGLARSGTTILLEALYHTGAFTSLTYRHMPFVHAPFFWSRLSSAFRTRRQLRERAHQDRLKVDYDSPEAFEEVFWLTFDANKYVSKEGLFPYVPDTQTVEDYRTFVQNVVAASEGTDSTRYLAKNNNNLLRIPALRQAFSDAVILVAFRHPLDQARSLLRQHELFLTRHERDAFGLAYMSWLGHFEFGANLKPFVLASHSRELWGSRRSVQYWLKYWHHVYDYVLRNHKADVLFVDYDQMCSEPSAALRQIAGAVGVDADVLMPFSAQISAPPRKGCLVNADSLEPQIEAVYAELRAASLVRPVDSA